MMYCFQSQIKEKFLIPRRFPAMSCSCICLAFLVVCRVSKAHCGKLTVNLTKLLGLATLATALTAHAIELAPSEQDYVARQDPILFCVDPDWQPFEQVDESGQHAGIAADLLRLVAQRTGLHMKLLQTPDWPASLKASKTGQCSVMSLLNQTPERSKWLAFTRPILTDENVLITREEHPFIADLAGLENHTMALPQGTSLEERIRKDYPNIHLIITQTEAQALAMVSDRRADLTMRSLIVAAYTIKKEGWFNLKIAGQVSGYANQLRIGVSLGQPTLLQILDKGVASITPVERQQIVDRHIVIQATTATDYALVWRVTGVMTLLVLTSVFWLHKLKRSHKALLASESLLLQAQRIAHLGSYIMDLTSNVTTVSAGLDELLGCPHHDWKRQSDWKHVVHPDDHKRLLRHFLEVADGRAPNFNLVHRITQNGNCRERWVHNQGQIDRDASGTPVSLVGTVQDITERREAELQLQLAKNLAEQTAEQQRQFIAMLSHEVRTPLTVMDTAAQVLHQRHKDQPDTMALISRLRRGSQRLSQFFDNCLASDRLQKGAFTFQPQPIDMESLAHWACEGAELMSGDHHIELDLEPKLPALMGDPALLRVLLMNLLSNALKFSPRQTVISLRLRKRGPNCQIQVTDQGPGIAEEEKNLVFEMYRRGRSARGTPGAGLGLALVHHVTRLHHGTINVSNAATGGAVLTVELPFALSEMQEAASLRQI